MARYEYLSNIMNPTILDEIMTLKNMPDSQIDTSDIPEIVDWESVQVGRFYCKTNTITIQWVRINPPQPPFFKGGLGGIYLAPKCSGKSGRILFQDTTVISGDTAALAIYSLIYQ